MNCKELVLGDWVMLNGSHYQIEEISQKGWVHLTIEGVRANITSDYLLDVLQPIPLTETILKKNGFENYFSADGVVYVCEVYKLQLLQRKNDEGWTIYANHFGFDKKELYVHEFQNALNLCGIEKKIKL